MHRSHEIQTNANQRHNKAGTMLTNGCVHTTRLNIARMS
jgi:hypothetical protein